MDNTTIIWQPIKYLDPKIKFPDVKWQNGRFVGTAWEHGDLFTYLVWTEPDKGGWQKGQELVCNVLRPRKSSRDNDTKQNNNSYYANFVLLKNSNLLSKDDTAKLKKHKVVSCATDSSASSKQQHQNPATLNSSRSSNGAVLNEEGASQIAHPVIPP
eukprot:760794-Ditylum_brightwellii.AAC.1